MASLNERFIARKSEIANFLELILKTTKGNADGICPLLKRRFPALFPSYEDLRRHFVPYYKQWEHYSGDPAFPVPTPPGYETTMSPGSAYMNFARWGLTPYGNLRRDLCHHLIKCLKA